MQQLTPLLRRLKDYLEWDQPGIVQAHLINEVDQAIAQADARDRRVVLLEAELGHVRRTLGDLVRSVEALSVRLEHANRAAGLARAALVDLTDGGSVSTLSSPAGSRKEDDYD